MLAAGVAAFFLGGGLAEADEATTEPVACDPMDWVQPAQLPPPVKQMTEAKYSVAEKAAWGEVDTSNLGADNPPADIGVDPEVQNTPVLVGWNPAAVYWSGDARNSAWDEAMLVACADWESRPDLAETALAHAEEAGCRGWLADALEFRITLRECRWDDAMAYGSAALGEAPKPWRRTVASWLFAAAVVDYKLEFAKDLARKHSLVTKEGTAELEAIVQSYRSEPSVKRVDPKAAVAAGIGEMDVTRQVTHIKVKDEYDAVVVKASLQKTQRAKLSAPGGGFQLVALGPGFANADLSLHFQFKPSDRKKTDFERSLRIGVNDEAFKEGNLFDIDLSAEKWECPEVLQLETSMYPWPMPQWEKEGAVRIIVLHQDVEAFLDGRRIYFGPMRMPEEKRKVHFFLQATGVDATVSQVAWKEIKGS